MICSACRTEIGLHTDEQALECAEDLKKMTEEHRRSQADLERQTVRLREGIRRHKKLQQN